MMKTVCEKDSCTGCMACKDICPNSAIEIKDTLLAYNAVIDETKCINCGACFKICQNNAPITGNKPTKWFRGWAKENMVRENGSSGGVASAISKAFINDGGYVCSCTFQHGEFIFESANNAEGLDKFKGSKYVKSNPTGIYKKIKEILKNNIPVLFIGLPCQAAAVKKYIGTALSEKLYTIDLICHGTPSPDTLDIFLNQHDYRLNDIDSIRFRKKTKFQLIINNKPIILNGVQDRYTIAFLRSLTYTENCYNCKYAQLKRPSDITLGDAWGSSDLSESESGISLILCQTKKGEELIEKSNLYLEDVEFENEIAHNGQLEHPSAAPNKRPDFFASLIEGENFDRLVFKYFPKNCIRQSIKKILIRLRLYST